MLARSEMFFDSASAVVPFGYFDICGQHANKPPIALYSLVALRERRVRPLRTQAQRSHGSWLINPSILCFENLIEVTARSEPGMLLKFL